MITDPTELARQFDEMFSRLPAFLEQVETTVAGWMGQEFTGTADEERIIATVDAMGSLAYIEVSSLSVRRLDNLSLGDAIVAAVHAAEATAEQAKAQMLGSLSFGGGNLGEFLADGGRRMDDWTR